MVENITSSGINPKPYKYQKIATEHIKRNKSTFLIAGLGVGKTRIVIEMLKDCKSHLTVLIIAPLSVARNVWPEELNKWDCDMNVHIALGNKKKRENSVTAVALFKGILIINPENIQWLCEELQKVKLQFDILVIDESTAFKSHQSKRFKALRKYISPYCKRRVLMTGTPMPNSVQDLWSQCCILDGGKSLGFNITAFRRDYMYQIPNREFSQWEPRKGAVEAVTQEIKHLVHKIPVKASSLTKGMTYTTEKVELDSKSRKLYETYSEELVISCANGDITSRNAAVLSSKLRQLSQGFMYTDDGRVEPFNTSKLERLKQILDDNRGTNFLIVYEFKADLDRLKKAIPGGVIFDSSIIDSWNTGKISRMFVQYRKASHGLNLQGGGHHIIWYGVPWSLEAYDQMNGRLFRQGQQNHVYVCRLISNTPIEKRVLKALDRKESNQANFFKIISNNS